jgi:hypothetical protein
MHAGRETNTLRIPVITVFSSQRNIFRTQLIVSPRVQHMTNGFKPANVKHDKNTAIEGFCCELTL